MRTKPILRIAGIVSVVALWLVLTPYCHNSVLLAYDPFPLDWMFAGVLSAALIGIGLGIALFVCLVLLAIPPFVHGLIDWVMGD